MGREIKGKKSDPARPIQDSTRDSITETRLLSYNGKLFAINEEFVGGFYLS